MNLIWHRQPSPSGALPPPISVNAWFEVGAHLDNIVVQPKFIWSSAYEPDLLRKRVHLSCCGPESIELLSIVRVIKPAELDRTRYPFVRLDQACCITTNDGREHVFEAQNTLERDWLVSSLKVIVARLASIIIVRDEVMLLEFFAPYAGFVSLADEEGYGADPEELHHPEPREYDD
jgi:hypothetical protein